MTEPNDRDVADDCVLEVDSGRVERAAFDVYEAYVNYDRRDRRSALLAQTIEAEIIPRLLLAHRVSGVDRPTAPTTDLGPSRDDVVAFTQLALGADPTAALAFIDALLARGVSRDRVLLDLLAPSARLLGDYWKADTKDFVEVTIGLGTLQRLLHDLSMATSATAVSIDPRRKAMLQVTPGEQHSFGVLMVEEFFRRAGWDVWRGRADSSDELLSAVRHEWFGVVGFSLSCEALLDRLVSVISFVRRDSRNQNVGILVGGPLFLEHPEFVGRVGADAMAADGRQAVELARGLIR